MSRRSGRAERPEGAGAGGPHLALLDHPAGGGRVDDVAIADVDPDVVVAVEDEVALAQPGLVDRPDGGLLLAGGPREGDPLPAVDLLGQPRAVDALPQRGAAVGVGGLADAGLGEVGGRLAIARPSGDVRA